MKIAAIGDNCVDVYPKLDRYYCTGNSVDFAVHMKRLGAEVSLISTTGNDEYGRQMIAELNEEEIDITHLKVGDGNFLYGSRGQGKNLWGLHRRRDGECGIF